MTNTLHLLYKNFRINLSIIFANKFIYFLLAGLIFYFGVAIINLFDADWYPSVFSVYEIQFIPALLFLFYPVVFGMQNDQDARTIEMLFGIPNYRYKIWLVRLLSIFMVVFLLILFMSTLSHYLIVELNIFWLSYHLMFPVLFFGSFAFMMSVLIRNGNGTAAVVVVLGLIFSILSEVVQETKWDILLNPFITPDDLYINIWGETIFYNRLYLFIASTLFILMALYRLQKREKFIG